MQGRRSRLSSQTVVAGGGRKGRRQKEEESPGVLAGDSRVLGKREKVHSCRGRQGWPEPWSLGQDRTGKKGLTGKGRGCENWEKVGLCARVHMGVCVGGALRGAERSRGCFWSTRARARASPFVNSIRLRLQCVCARHCSSHFYTQENEGAQLAKVVQGQLNLTVEPGPLYCLAEIRKMTDQSRAVDRPVGVSEL